MTRPVVTRRHSADQALVRNVQKLSGKDHVWQFWSFKAGRGRIRDDERQELANEHQLAKGQQPAKGRPSVNEQQPLGGGDKAEILEKEMADIGKNQPHGL